MEIRVVEVIRLSSVAGEAAGRAETFKSWRKAWEYYELDCHHSRRCPSTKIARYDGLAIVQHWGDTFTDAVHACPEYEEDLDKRLADVTRELTEREIL